MLTKTCPTCGRGFGKNPRYSQAQWSGARFCSVPCKNASLVKERRLCGCGCGQQVTQPRFTYRTGHNQRGEGVYLYLWKVKGRKPRWVVADRHARRHYYARAVMAAHLRRELASGEVVHHINGDATDDRIENLRLFASNAEHMRHEWATGAVKGRW